ncbi:MAG: hypothetical protein HOM91_00170 [Tateyamaria sp.]|nr:hypothetical protein [Tateyamaria sp.]
MSRIGVHLALYNQPNPTPNMFSALNGPKWHQQANSRLTTPNQTRLQRRAGVRARGGCGLTIQDSHIGNVRSLTRICLALCLA